MRLLLFVPGNKMKQVNHAPCLWFYTRLAAAGTLLRRNTSTIGLGVQGAGGSVGAVKDFRQLLGKGVTVKPKK